MENRIKNEGARKLLKKLLGGKTLMSPHILFKVWGFSKRISLEKAVDPHVQSL